MAGSRRPGVTAGMSSRGECPRAEPWWHMCCSWGWLGVGFWASPVLSLRFLVPPLVGQAASWAPGPFSLGSRHVLGRPRRLFPGSWSLRIASETTCPLPTGSDGWP